ncbi:MAG: twin-arginine translocase subunit TatC [Firmicutes bacterium]|nr:twin-arginine translocase subunit TatC [Bacillota bacterium]
MAGEMATEFAGLQERLGEFRGRIIRSLAVFAAAAVVSYVFSERMLGDMLRRLPSGAELVFLSPSEAFFARLKLALAGGLVLALPVLLWQILAFISPYLNPRDRRAAMLLIPLAFGLFLLGASFSYLIMLPFALRFLLGFGGAQMQPMLSVSPYVGFVLLLVLPLGLIFELPIVMVFLTRIGVVDPQGLASRRKYVVFLIFIVSALLTPADVFSQVLMAIPLLVLFEFSLIVSRLAKGRSGG